MTAATHTNTQKKSAPARKRTRTPVARTVRRLVSSFEDLIDDVVTRGEGVERDARNLVHNLVKSNDTEDRKARGRDDDEREEGEREEDEEHDAEDRGRRAKE